MNAATVLREIKNLVAGSTGYNEHTPRRSNDAGRPEAPNSPVFRVVILGTGQTKHAGLRRYVELAIVLSAPLSGGDANKSNLDAAVEAEALITDLTDYDSAEAQTEQEIDSDIGRESGRVVTTISCRVNYKLEATI